jgi:hypothetical protein
VPAHAQQVFRRIVSQRITITGHPPMVLDLGCSYGLNAALLNHDVTLDDLYARYCSSQVDALAPHELAEDDRVFFGERRLASAVHITGLDVADRAVTYAHRARLHDCSGSENLERAEPSRALQPILAQVDLIIATGVIGYVSDRTFRRIFDHSADGHPAWVAAFALRWAAYDRIAEALRRYGLVTEKLPRTFRQRRFADDVERQYVLKELDRMGIDPHGRESDGWLHAELFLSRPARDVEAAPLQQLLGECP